MSAGGVTLFGRVEGEGTVGVTVEITPRDTQCTVGCGGESPATPPTSLPATGSEPVSAVLAGALLLAGAVALMTARLRDRRASQD